MSAEATNPAPPPPPIYYAAPPGTGSRSGCLIAMCVFLALGLGVSMLMNLALLGSRATPQIGPAKPADLKEKWVDGSGSDKVALIAVEGVIMEEQKSEGMFGATTKLVERVRRELAAAEKDKDVKAVLLEVNSPGGSVSASDEIWHLIKKFKERAKKPVVVWMSGLAASGGYYISAPADVIYCSPTTITGSIGVIMSSFNFSGSMQRFDVQNITIKAGRNKDLLNPFQPIREDHVRIIQDMIDKTYDIFVQRVAEGRAAAGLTEDAVRSLADGRIFLSKEALSLKLVDKEGYREDAFAECRKRAGIQEATLFRYADEHGLLDVLTGNTEARGPAAPTSLEALLSLETPRPMFLWQPGVGR
jgi:protease-4